MGKVVEIQVEHSGQQVLPTFYLRELKPGEVDVTEQTNFYLHRWIINGHEGYTVVLESAVAMHRTYNAPFLSAVRVRRVGGGVEADIFTLDTLNLPNLPEGVRWLPVVLR